MRPAMYELLRDAAPPALRRYVRGVYGAILPLQVEAQSLPAPARAIAPFSVRLMDTNDPHDLAAWLRIQHDAFGMPAAMATFDTVIRHHPTYDVRRTYFLVDGDEPVGAASAAVFRRNPAVGCGHQAALLPKVRGKGLGLHLALVRYRSLVDEGLLQLETETALFYRQSIRNHFRLGFRPKPRLDPWNHDDASPAARRLLATLILTARHRRWQRTSESRHRFEGY